MPDTTIEASVGMLINLPGDPCMWGVASTPANDAEHPFVDSSIFAWYKGGYNFQTRSFSMQPINVRRGTTFNHLSVKQDAAGNWTTYLGAFEQTDNGLTQLS